MNSTIKSKPSAGTELEHELTALEDKQAALIAHTLALRAANESLRRELAAADARSKTLAERVAEAALRLDALLARLPEVAE
jgi:predicted  nucleic acid-binding Zn-ribbon protein